MANRNFNKGIRRLTTGNHFGYCNGYWIFIFRRPHGKWCVEIGKKKELIWREGYHGTSLRNIKAAKQWAKFHIVPSCTEQWID